MPREVLQWAKAHRRSALHAALEWDDSKAAEEYRLAQVRELIRVNVVDVSGEPEMVSLSVDRAQGGGYRSVQDVIDDRALSEILLQDAVEELDRMKARYDRVAALTAVWRAVDRVREKLPSRKPAKARSPRTRGAGGAPVGPR